MEISHKIEDIRKLGVAEREKILIDKAKHEALRHGRDPREPVGIQAMVNAERLRRHHNELWRYKHPKSKRAKALEVPSGTKDIDEMWTILKEARRKNEDI